MFWFTAGVIINCIAIVLVIANAVYDAITLKYASGHNTWVNLIGIVLAIVVIVAYSVKNSGKISLANLILWVPGTPILIFSAFTLVYFIVILISKPDWR
ncbi:hypothetical protein [Dyadobacter sp. CY326]|uniref:hypothetical protein n=1 Tax=Dyadobacter sp. CY326 TaxID=2907300 RepID=UPI001F2C03D9|nr:hypothetical protein [Dyadobacter sp. CY326]MCE7064205.1 hypothetical protein [Dyadobacter sp. CY326]